MLGPDATPALTRRSLLHLGGGFALVLGVGACAAGEEGSQTTNSSGSGSSADTLRIAVTSYPSSWDQDYVGFDIVGLMIYKNMYAYMVDYGTTPVDGTPILDTTNIGPAFAESFESDADGKVWTLKLRQGVKFASGNELTADDVKWSKDRAFAAASNVAGIYRTIGLTSPDQVVVIDDYTVEFRQEFASALTPQIQAIGLYVFDSTLAQENATADDPWAKDWIAKNAASEGYFTVESATAGQEVVLAANANYPGPDPAKTATIRLPVVTSGANQRLQLEAGDIDIALGITGQDLQDLKEVDGVNVISAPSNDQVLIQMNTAAAPFDNVEVRKALAYAVPYEQIIANVFNGDARPCHSPVPLDMPGYSDTGYPYTYDLDKAKAALATAGQSAITAELVFEADNDTQQRIAVQVQAEAAKAGIELTLTPLDPATLGERRTQKSIPLQLTSGQLWVNDVEYMLATSLVSGAALNHANYTNPEVEQIYTESHTTVDETARLALWTRVQEILAEDVPWVVVCQPNFNLPVRENVSGWVQPMDGLARLRYLGAAG